MVGGAMKMAGRRVFIVVFVVRTVARNLWAVFARAVPGHERPESIGERDSMAQEQKQRHAPGAWSAKLRGADSHERLFQFSAAIA